MGIIQGFEAGVEKARLNAGVAQMIYDLRLQKELSQKELARLAETRQSIISRLELRFVPVEKETCKVV